jgi:hypothetical protein
MSFKRLETDDFVVSADAITAPLWTGNNPTLTQFFTSSVQAAGSTGIYYLSVYQTGSALAGAEVQFDVVYGNKYGSGSTLYNTAVGGKSPTSTVYGQYRTLVNGDENTDFDFGGLTATEFYGISISRNRYKETLFPGSLTLTLKSGSNSLTLTDNSQVASTVVFKDAGRVFQLVSGSAGSVNTSKTSTGYTPGSGSYGWFLPDIGTILLNPLALSASVANGGMALNTDRTSNTNTYNHWTIASAISGGASFTLNSQETITSDYIFVRPRSSEFNYSENPSFISGSTGEVIYADFVSNPQTYITTVGLYNDTNDLLAVAKLSRPLKKDFTKEALVRVKLDF